MFWGDSIQHMTQGDPERRGDECPLFLPAPSPSLPTLPSLRHLLIRSLRLSTQPHTPCLLLRFRGGGSWRPLKQGRREPGRAQMDRRTDRWKERRVS